MTLTQMLRNVKRKNMGNNAQGLVLEDAIEKAGAHNCEK